MCYEDRVAAEDSEPRSAAQDETRAQAIQRLIELTKREDVLDWDLFDRIDELAWGYPPE
jgi:hypothetical protein